MDPSLSAWRQFLERLPADHPLRRVVFEARTENTAEDAVLRLAAIVESSDDAILSKTLDGRILSWNGAATRIYGYAADEVLGRHVSMLNAPGQADDTAAILDRILEGTGLDHYETTRARKDGRVIDVSLTVSPVRDAQGRVVAASTIARDITDRKRAERRLQFLADAGSAIASSLDFETTLTSVARLAVPALADWCTVDVVDDSGALRRVAAAQKDPAAKAATDELAAYPPGARSGSGAAGAIASRRATLLADIDDAFLRSIASDARHLELLRSLEFRSAMVIPLLARGRLVGLLTFALTGDGRRYDAEDLALGDELARRAGLAIENARLYRDAQTANRMKDEFLATLSHELRTPLTPILGWTRILRSGGVDATTAERALEVIERNVEAQSRLIDDLLDLSRIASGKLRLELKPADLSAVIESAVEAIRPTADARAIGLESRLEAKPAMVYADADRMRQVAWNLLTNAVKFTPRGGRVTVTLARVDSSVELRVADTGEGIAPEFLPYIFNRFHQADSSATRMHGGLGLGLAIVRHLVELHGGRVEVQSEGLNRGSTFTVRLPLLAVAARAAQPAASLGALAQDGEADDTFKGLRVLVVDDEPDARELLTTLLEMRGAKVETAASVGEALQDLSAWHPDVILADIGMPGADGYEFIARLRAASAEDGGRTPAIALTAYARDQDRQRALAAGFQAHLAKPVEPDDLFAALASVTGLDRSSRQP